MRTLGKFLGRGLILLIFLVCAAWLFGPYENADLKAAFEPRKFGEGVQVYFETIEARFDDITPGVEKRVIWAGQQETRTPVSVLYVHGFSATSEEIRPVPDRIATALGANLVYTRLHGHGRGADPMAEATVQGWMRDTAEGLAAARAVGDRVVVIATSTGGTLIAAALQDPVLSEKVDAAILVSPNFGINHPLAFTSTWPFARSIIRLAEGERRLSTPGTKAEAKYWSYNYPTSSVAVMAALVKAVVALDFSNINIPTLFWISDDDKVVRPDITRTIADRWGGPVTIKTVTMGPGDDPSSHVISGDIMSPGQTDIAVDGMLGWLEKGLN